MVEELISKIPPERCWEITAKTLTGLQVLRGEKSVAPLLGMGEGIIAPVMGAEKWQEIHIKIYSDGGKQMFPWVKETFNIPVENAIDADSLLEVVSVLMLGPEGGSESGEFVEKSLERVVWRINKCVYMERYKEFDVDFTLIPCIRSCPEFFGEGFKAINPKIKYKMMKKMPEGDPYCEYIIEFKEE